MGQKYYIDEDKLWAYTFIPSPNLLDGNRDPFLQEFGLSDQEVDQFDLKQYVTDFINGDLINLEGPVQSYETQKRFFALAMLKLHAEYGWTNVHVNKRDIWQDKESMRKGRFVELIFALQKEGYIDLKGLPYKDGFVIDITDKLRCYINELDLNAGISDDQSDDQRTDRAMKLRLDYNEKTREIKINGILVSRPDFDSTNHSIIDTLFNNAGTVFSREQLQNILRDKHLKPFNAFLNEIRIKGTVRKYLFQVSKENIGLIREITVTDSDDFAKLSEELEILKIRKR